ncbi:AEL009Cp [Eremothecium gossypii ATCC 10895]|uniref:Mediator of RNA polymerase II transcription subunit 2 n=1 Tax=Eremothecium gossypii (strain ATCC 10895 / CBS 109.51 / FGSC 9923 / NRRL Y-1056) TaxID=284811 RepID=MED2_EREGS|nr:AEL009Cp [Eremothecium gossypii ATCC 10895]Q757M0.1 RecName: Full=Mediator of RNA polymerase II transcription subunit 2; AltName: Full=Mediator complex subunit 2 [Eremothecium gossypii ATCC 10895]AAS52676.1 AEL009Cp [Eremothecium gossypii ATCC 10895]AEY96981.1 FAEL009Cp [Eremothecium gossypii FDAG1]
MIKELQGGNMATKFKTDEEMRGDRLTQCLDDIMRASTEMMVQQQLKTIQLNSDVAAGFRKALSKSLGDRVRAFHSILDGVETTLTTASQYLDAVEEAAVKMKQWKQQQEEEQRRKHQAELEKNKRQQEHDAATKAAAAQQLMAQQSPVDLTAPTPTGLASNLDKSNRVGGVKPFSAEFGHLDEMDLSMFGGIDGHGDFSLEDFNMGGNSVPLNGGRPRNMVMADAGGFPARGGMGRGGATAINNGAQEIKTSTNEASTNNRNNDGTGGASNPRISSNYNSAVADHESIGLRVDANGQNTKQSGQQSGAGLNPDDYLTLNDFNDLGIDWNTGENNELDLNDFNI